MNTRLDLASKSKGPRDARKGIRGECTNIAPNRPIRVVMSATIVRIVVASPAW
jgi:hypothetical protein